MTTIEEILKREVESPARTEDGRRIFSGTALGLYLPLNPKRVNLDQMARRCYGYGRWDAPYWFIGPEQGMSSREEIDWRVSAWNRDFLDDCSEFHKRIREYRWHENPVKLQKTWKQLMLLLMAFKGRPLDLSKPEDKAVLCNYQGTCWGMRSGETCLIELSGLPANSYASSKRQKAQLFEPKEFERIREQRIEFIKEKMREQMRDHKLKLVVMYGLKERNHFEKIAQVVGEVPTGNSPIIKIATHPVSFEGVKNEYWTDLGLKLRHERTSIR